MATIHNLVSHADSGLKGIQSTQRDWSPFVAHFTSFAAMETIRTAIRAGDGATDVASRLADADERSAEIAEKIGSSGRLLARSPSERDGIPPCVCFSECSLPGLLGHCERYGRFGWVFRKDRIFGAGGRPCIYVDDDAYAELAARGRDEGAPAGQRRLFGLANVYRPPGFGQVQDYTHEREWRLFDELDLSACPPEAVIAPVAFQERVRTWFPTVRHLVPIDMLHEWGL